jgi:hypothetical protein
MISIAIRAYQCSYLPRDRLFGHPLVPTVTNTLRGIQRKASLPDGEGMMTETFQGTRSMSGSLDSYLIGILLATASRHVSLLYW